MSTKHLRRFDTEAWLASVTAATAEGLLDRKSSPKSEIRRQRQICESATDILMGRWTGATHELDRDRIIQRLETVATALRERE